MHLCMVYVNHGASFSHEVLGCLKLTHASHHQSKGTRVWGGLLWGKSETVSTQSAASLHTGSMKSFLCYLAPTQCHLREMP